jgi:uncharacterized protein (TIGR03118 family)
MRNPRRRAPVFLLLPLLGASAAALGQNVLSSDSPDTPPPGGTNDYRVTVLVSNESDEAPVVDPLLKNAWGIVRSPQGPWWVANNDTNTSTVYTGDGTKLGLEPAVSGGPTGVVFNAGSSFQMQQGKPAAFLFAALDGSFSAWNGDVNPNAVVVHTSPGSVYTGLAIQNNTLFTADFADCEVEAFRGNFFDDSFDEVDTPGGFPPFDVPIGYCPFGIKAIGNSVYVTYAKVGPDGDEEHGVGLGYVRKFDTDGNFVARVASRDPLNAPWGIAQAPGDWGRFSGCILIGNFGDGKITGWCPNDKHGERKYRFAGFLKDKNETIVIDGLWGLGFGNNHLAGPSNVLFFGAGPDEEVNGYFGKIEFHPAD